MQMDGRRESGNVEDRRGQGGRGGNLGGGFGNLGGFGGGGGNLIANLLPLLLQLFMNRKGGGNGGNGGKGGGCGCGLIAIVVIGVLLFSQLGGGLLSGLSTGSQQEQTEYKPSALEDELATFSAQVLAGTEDVWTQEFAKMGRTYKAPKLVLFTDATRSGCGNASSSTGPFYCSADQTVYIDLSFFMNMKRQLGADGDFAYAYVIAHEVGHHVQYLLGDLDKVHRRMRQVSERESNQLSVRLELQADFYAGVWAYHDNKMFRSLEDGDIEEGINAAQKIGDDYLQKKAQGYAVPESFNHGTSAQRMRWLKKGITTGNVSLGDTFSPSYEGL